MPPFAEDGLKDIPWAWRKQAPPKPTAGPAAACRWFSLPRRL